MAFGSFVWLGVKHIFGGYDHLAFLLALLLGCTRWRMLVAIVSAFTIGHSLSLAFATLDLVDPPAGLIEPLIAASIVAVGLLNFFQSAARHNLERVPLTLIFGLAHGFGFAHVLRDLGVGRDGGSITAPLLGFNIGVELGQLTFAMLVLPALWWMRRHAIVARRVEQTLSLAIAALGFYWLMERLFFN